MACLQERLAAYGILEEGRLSSSALRQLLASYTMVIRLGGTFHELSANCVKRGIKEFTLFLMSKQKLVAYEPLVGASSSSAAAKGKAASRRATVEARFGAPPRRFCGDPRDDPIRWAASRNVSPSRVAELAARRAAHVLRGRRLGA